MSRIAALNRFRRIMSLITMGTPLPDVLEAIIDAIEEEDSSIACSIYLLNQETHWLHLAAAPSLPPAYRQDVMQAPIGPDVGSCPVAAYRNEMVIVQDLHNDPLWAPIKSLLEGTDLRACWSEPIRGEQGEVLGTFAIYRQRVGGPTSDDVTFMQSAAELASLAIGRTRSEEALRAARDAAEEANRQALQAERMSGIGHWRYDIATGAFALSEQMYRIYGLEADGPDAETFDPIAFCHPDDRERMIAEREANVGQGAPPLELRIVRPDGEVRHVIRRDTVELDAEGRPVARFGTLQDVTETKLAEAELEDARRKAEAAAAAKSAFLANMSHELRTPLTSITGFARLIEEQTQLPEDARRYTRRIRDASEALLAIINDVLDFSKLESGRIDLERHPLAVGRLVEEVAGLVSVQASAKALALEFETDAEVPAQVMGDVARLRQVLLNFLSNAVKFTDAGSVRIRSSYDAERQRLRVAVTDTGRGIEPDAVERIFERFTQADVSINRTHGGTGLGLAISKGLIELMGGELGVETQPGEGSTFWFEVPAAPSSVSVEAPQEELTALDGGLHILVVDDTAVNRELVRLMLEPLGVKVQEASGGAEAVQSAMNTRFDLILMDVRMPGVDGLEAAQVIRGASPVNGSTPILALTADVQPENAAACRSAGMNEVLAKPIVPQQLLTAIARHTAAPEEELAETA
jgi:signal transduction histidine kinase/ActR/RegA family two-component response regulator